MSNENSRMNSWKAGEIARVSQNSGYESLRGTLVKVLVSTIGRGAAVAIPDGMAVVEYQIVDGAPYIYVHLTKLSPLELLACCAEEK